MQSFFCEEMPNKKRNNKKAQIFKGSSNESKVIDKKRKIEYFTDSELTF